MNFFGNTNSRLRVFTKLSFDIIESKIIKISKVLMN
jgi:hypothetical protein